MSVLTEQLHKWAYMSYPDRPDNLISQSVERIEQLEELLTYLVAGIDNGHNGVSIGMFCTCPEPLQLLLDEFLEKHERTD